jgi:hypothetical protein
MDEAGKPDDDAKLRGQAVEMFGRLERGLDSVIVSYYVARHPLATYFTLDALSAEGFSYSLRREIFVAIVRRHGWYDEKRMQHLYAVGRWRNFLAHVAGMETHDYGDDREIPKIGYRDPKHPHTTLTIAEAFERFKPELEQADEYVSEIIRKVTPVDRFQRSGHVVENPIAEEDTYEAWINRPFDFGDPHPAKE